MLKKTTLSIIISATLTFTSMSISAETTTIKVASNNLVVNADVNNDKAVKQSLKKMLAEVDHFSATFEQKVLDEEGNELQQASGTIKVSKPNLVYWHTEQPNESLIVSDGATLWFFDPFIEQASAYGVNQSVANTPILLLSSDNDELWQHYQVIKMNENHYLINSKDENSKVKTLALYFNEKIANQLIGFDIIDSTGQISKIVLTDIDSKSSIDKSSFNFTLPAGADLDDQR